MWQWHKGTFTFCCVYKSSVILPILWSRSICDSFSLSWSGCFLANIWITSGVLNAWDMAAWMAYKKNHVAQDLHGVNYFHRISLYHYARKWYCMIQWMLFHTLIYISGRCNYTIIPSWNVFSGMHPNGKTRVHSIKLTSCKALKESTKVMSPLVIRDRDAWNSLSCSIVSLWTSSYSSGSNSALCVYYQMSWSTSNHNHGFFCSLWTTLLHSLHTNSLT